MTRSGRYAGNGSAKDDKLLDLAASASPIGGMGAAVGASAAWAKVGWVANTTERINMHTVTDVNRVTFLFLDLP